MCVGVCVCGGGGGGGGGAVLVVIFFLLVSINACCVPHQNCLSELALMRENMFLRNTKKKINK